MPVRIISNSYQDNFSSPATSIYRSNIGDKTTLTQVVESDIRYSTTQSPLLLDVSNNEIYSTGPNWLDEGFIVGDTVSVNIYDTAGAVVHTYSTTVLYVNQSILGLNAVTHFYDSAAGETMVIEVTGRNRGDLLIAFNQIQNSNNTGSIYSLIDGEATRATFTNLHALTVGSTQTGALVGNQSGQFLQRITIERNADSGNTRVYTITYTFLNSGLYNQTAFTSADCLKNYISLEWDIADNNPTRQTVVSDSEKADTGYFNQAYNVGVVDTVLQSTNFQQLDYSTTTTGLEIVIDGDINNISLGAAYESVDDTYYKNQVLNQEKISMMIYTQLATGTLTSLQNSSGAGYNLIINSVNTIGTQTTINFDFQPNTAFKTFMANRSLGDRKFFIWVKGGTQNIIAHANQLYKAEVAGTVLSLSTDVFKDHANIDVLGDADTPARFDTEDDVSYTARFLLTKNQLYSTFKVRLMAYNNVTGEEFDLQESLFSFASIPYDSTTGIYSIDQQQTIVTTLPTTSDKRIATFKRYPANDTVLSYGVELYYPFLCRWEYWLNLLISTFTSSFYPNQNKNWQQYSAATNWGVKIRLELTDSPNGTTDFYDRPFTITDYDYDANVDSGIALYRDSTGAYVNIIPQGEIMTIYAVHKNLTGNWADVWGAITVEPFESAPRQISSSIIDYDNNLQNPLTPVSGTKIAIDLSTPDWAVLSCKFDTNKIDLTNGVKITSKIKGDTVAPWTNAYSLGLDGIMQYAESASTYSALNGLSKATFSVWIKPDNLTSHKVIFSNQRNTTATESQFFLWLRPSASYAYELDFSIDDTPYYCRSTTGYISAGAWNHVCIVLDLNETWKCKIYVNGVDRTYGQNMGSIATTLPNASGKLALGEDLNGYLNPFEGNLDEFAILADTALDSTAVANIYNSGNPADLSSLSPSLYWRCGDNNSGTGLIITDQGSSANNGALINSASFETDVP
jgi:hypothetical protein|tara:strand:- start:8661 stop:11555 length:2895 start_codon:yes stop_codon:yes gene_type:complete